METKTTGNGMKQLKSKNYYIQLKHNRKFDLFKTTVPPLFMKIPHYKNKLMLLFNYVGIR